MNYSSYFTNRPTAEICADLLGRPLTFNDGKQILGGYIVEAEAYLGKKDRAAHSYGGHRSPANEGLYARGGTIYIYAQRQYFFFDVATQKTDEPQGILIRAIEPTWGINQMVINRAGKVGPLLTNGPAKMMQALGIHNKKWNLHFLSDSPFTIDLNDQHQKQAAEILSSPRIGINQSDHEWAQKPLRFYVAGNPYVSKMPKSAYQTTRGWI
ncbi:MULTISPECIES: DNA-3-methyladenine glycosylase [unclassified Lactobacillus]|uniref:DNA-3-methyladenine glycosylase n=1 Tax=unclassified Lactobacillus TaxID=2620435 RepID=UPI000EFC3F67|nr:MULTISPECIES: DNA-3-methyladenine glycosylase [unclassified Lactobacillus]RMC26051.1 DNA-3-methyladenine glycosylase [Lactobacillus sp. ESL0247]RMC29744.1 DNA-3-methyladenine glycosylase [Lactobacillus sp. ESL0246]RMC34149.1 DNA-3-methyladenine glycosylase [Lactobacillus sp. ESL0245]RMC51932.1 DNA-3-methyladenine glycosylase [Lactobacillus sp. ESL0228]